MSTQMYVFLWLLCGLVPYFWKLYSIYRDEDYLSLSDVFTSIPFLFSGGLGLMVSLVAICICAMFALYDYAANIEIARRKK